MESLTFITGNVEKAKQLGIHLNYPVQHQKLDVPEIQSFDLEEIAIHKAQAAYNQVKSPVLVEDTALTFSALGALPGPFIKWFLEALDNDGLVQLLTGRSDRTAVAQVCFALCDGVTTEIFHGEAHGSIALEPRGERGFGWDPIFIPDGCDLTWGETDPETQKETSMRRIALSTLQDYLKTASLYFGMK